MSKFLLSKNKQKYKNEFVNIVIYNKIIIILLPLLFGFLFYFYSKNLEITKSSTAWLSKTSPIFESYLDNFQSEDNNLNKGFLEVFGANIQFKDGFIDIFLSKIISEKNFSTFLDMYNRQNISINEKIRIKNSFSDFLFNDDQFILKKIFTSNIYKIQIEHQMKIQGTEILNDYVSFTTKESLFHFLKKSKISTENKINEIKNALIVSKENNIFNLNNNNFSFQNSDITTTDYENLIFFFNSNFLEKKLEIYQNRLYNLNELYDNQKNKQINLLIETKDSNNEKNNINEDLFSWDPVVKTFTSVKQKPTINYFIQGFILGILLFFLYIFYKVVFLRKI